MISADRLREVLDYDPDTGIFTWKGGRARSAGRVAGHPTKYGYIRVTVDYHAYMAHVLAWIYMTGERPLQFVDHQDDVDHIVWVDDELIGQRSLECRDMLTKYRDSPTTFTMVGPCPAWSRDSIESFRLTF